MFSLFRKKTKSPETELTLDLEPGEEWTGDVGVSPAESSPDRRPGSIDVPAFAVEHRPDAVDMRSDPIPSPPLLQPGREPGWSDEFYQHWREHEAMLNQTMDDRRAEWRAAATSLLDAKGFDISPELRLQSIEQLVGAAEDQFWIEWTKAEARVQARRLQERHVELTETMVDNQEKMIAALGEMAEAIERGNTVAQLADFVRSHPILAGFLGTAMFNR